MVLKVRNSLFPIEISRKTDKILSKEKNCTMIWRFEGRAKQVLQFRHS